MAKKISNKTVLALVIAVTVVGIISLLAISIRQTSNEQSEYTKINQDESSLSQDSDSADGKADSDDWQYYQIGETMKFATQEMRVNSVRLTNYIKESDEYSAPEHAGEGAQFLVINMTIRNTTNQTFGYRAFSLIDQDGNQYEDYSGIGSIDNYLDVRDLSPNIPETGNAVYRVSSSSKSFTLFGMNSDTGKTLAIKLNP